MSYLMLVSILVVICVLRLIYEFKKIQKSLQ